MRAFSFSVKVGLVKETYETMSQQALLQVQHLDRCISCNLHSVTDALLLVWLLLLNIQLVRVAASCATARAQVCAGQKATRAAANNVRSERAQLQRPQTHSLPYNLIIVHYLKSRT